MAAKSIPGKLEIDPVSQTGSIIGLILLCGLILRAHGFHSPVDYDEAYSIVEFGTKTWWTAFSDYSLPNNHLFHSVLVKASTLLFGIHTWSVRLPAMAAGLGVILAAYFLGRQIYNKEAGILAAVFTAFSPELIRYSTSARGYSLLDLIVLLLFLIGYRVITESGYKLWVLMAVCTAFGFWTLPLMLYPAGAIYIWVITSGPRTKRFFYSWLSSGVFAGILSLLFYSPVLIFSGWRKLFSNAFVQPVDVKKFYDWLLVERLRETWDSWTINLPVILVIIISAGFLISIFIQLNNQTSRISLQLIIIAWCAFLIIFRRPDMFDRFWSWLVSPVLVWSAGGLITIISKIPLFKKNSMYSVYFSTALLLLYTIIYIPSIPGLWSKQSNAEAAANFVSQNYQPGDVILAGYPNNASVWFYLLESNVSREAWLARNDAKRYIILLAANQKDQSLLSIIKDYHLDPAVIDLQQSALLAEYGKIKIFACKSTVE